MVLVESGDAGNNDDDGDWQCGQQNRTEENKMQQNRTGENRGEGPDQRVAVVAQGETDHTPHVWRYCHRHHNLCCVSCFPNVVTKISIFSKAINGVNPRCSQNLLSNKATEKYKEPKKPTSKDQS